MNPYRLMKTDSSIGNRIAAQRTTSPRYHERRLRHACQQDERDARTGLPNQAYFTRCVRDGRWRNDPRRYTTLLAFASVSPTHQCPASPGRTASGSERTGDVTVSSESGVDMKTLAQHLRDHLHEDDLLLHPERGMLLVIRSGAVELESWIWAQHTLEQLESQGITCRAGLAVEPTGCIDAHLPQKMWPLLELAGRMDGQSVVSVPMAFVESHARTVARQHVASAYARRTIWLQQIMPTMGPTQREHLTDHCEQVSRLAGQFAASMNMSRSTIQQVAAAALFHDIGKAMVPERLLAKPSALTEGEWSWMKQHDMYGRTLCKALGLSEQIASIVGAHHEHYAGQVIADMQSPVGLARIITVADAMVTMQTDRPYQRAQSLRSALAELRRHRGHQFDPHVVDVAHHVMMDFDQTVLAA